MCVCIRILLLLLLCLYLWYNAGLEQTTPHLDWMMWTAPPVSIWWFCSAPSAPPLTPTVSMDVMMSLSFAVSSFLPMQKLLLILLIPYGTVNSNLWSNPYNGMVRLSKGQFVNEGLVEVYCNGQWGTVCDNGFTSNDANTVCKQLGYSEAVRYDHLDLWV